MTQDKELIQPSPSQYFGATISASTASIYHAILLLQTCKAFGSAALCGKNTLNCSSNHQVMALLLYVSFITWCEDIRRKLPAQILLDTYLDK